jgi:anti-sigma B factor antagonist
MTKVTTNIRDKSDVKIVDASQYLGGDAAIDLREILDTLVAQNVLKIIVNLSAVEHINSRSIGTLIGTAKKLHTVDGVLKVYGLAEHIRQIFDLIGASSIVEIYDSEDDALSNF